MDTNKDFFSQSNALVGVVDFLKWTSSLGEGMIDQMQNPLPGVRLSPGLSHLFALGCDDIGWMLLMNEAEATWLERFPIASVLVDCTDGLVLVSEPFIMLDQKIGAIGIDLFIPSIELRERIAKETLLGFGLMRKKNQVVERVNHLVPVMRVADYATLSKQTKDRANASLFAA